MKSLLLGLVFAGIALGAGRFLLHRVFRLPLSGIEGAGHALALGLGVGSFGTFGLGIAGLYSPLTVGGWWAVLGGLGIADRVLRGRGRPLSPEALPPQSPLPVARSGSQEKEGENDPAFSKGVAGETPGPARPSQAGSSPLAAARSSRGSGAGGEGLLSLFCRFLLLVFGVVSLLNCFVAPNGLQWDAISYHLADQKLFLILGRIVSLPTEHHSNFPLIADTLFGVGLMFSDFALANLFSFLFGAAAVAVLYGFCARTLSRTAGEVAAVLWVSTPVVLWEFSVAYLDLAVALYTCAAIFLLIHPPVFPDSSAPPSSPPSLPLSKAVLLLAGVEMGFALGCKYLALVPFGLCAAFLAMHPVRRRGVLAFAGAALALASPWFVRNLLTVQNPVYPFAYSIFPGSKYWSADRAAAYQGEQDGFGESHKLSQPLQTLPHLLQVPLRTLTHPDRYSNPGEVSFSTTAGLAGALGLFALFLPGLPRAAKLCLGFGALQWAGWFFTAQVLRYLIPFLPPLCVGAAALIAWACTGEKGEAPSLSAFPAQPLFRFLALALFAGQGLLTLWSVARLPDNARDASGVRIGWSSLSLFTIKDAFTDGSEARLRRTLDNYGAMEWINANTPPVAKVLLYDDVRGFYLDRFYVWADYNHSSWIDYGRLSDALSLTRWLNNEGFRYAVFNLNQAWGSRYRGEPPPRNREYEAFAQWYGSTAAEPGDWRKPIYEAVRAGFWKPVFARNGVIVVQVGEAGAR